MRCPKCGQQNQDGVQFCFNCGNKLDVMNNRPPQGGGQMPPNGMGMPPQGRPVNQQGGMRQMPPQGMGRPPQGMGGNTPPPRRVSPSTMEWQGGPQGRNVPPNMRQTGRSLPSDGRPRREKKKKNNTTLIIAASVLGTLLLVVAIVLVLSVTGVFEKDKPQDVSVAEEENPSNGSTGKPQNPGEESEDEDSQPAPSSDMVADMLEPVNEMVDEAKEVCDTPEINDLDDGLSRLSEAIGSYIEIGKECGDKSQVEDKVYSTYNMFVEYADDGIGTCKSLMNGCLGEQPAGDYGKYFECMTDIYTIHMGIASYMKDEEYDALPDEVEADFKGDRVEYISKLIERFNKFTGLTANKYWSRTECWTLMESVDPKMMFLVEDEEDLLSDPVYQRYIWAASYNLQKTAETNIASGEWTAKHAADSIRGAIVDSDYGMYVPFLFQEYIMYATQAGINCQAQIVALKQCEQLLMSEQHLDVNKVKDGWKLVWFFNDFGECTSNGVDTTINIVDGNHNGIRKDVREQIMGILASSFD